MRSTRAAVPMAPRYMEKVRSIWSWTAVLSSRVWGCPRGTRPARERVRPSFRKAATSPCAAATARAWPAGGSTENAARARPATSRAGSFIAQSHAGRTALMCRPRHFRAAPQVPPRSSTPSTFELRSRIPRSGSVDSRGYSCPNVSSSAPTVPSSRRSHTASAAAADSLPPPVDSADTDSSRMCPSSSRALSFVTELGL